MLLRIPRLFQWKELLFTLTITLISLSFCVGQAEFEEITFKEFFDRIEKESSPTVKFKDLFITDNYSNADTLIINKNLVLENVIFSQFHFFKGIIFNKSVEMINSAPFNCTSCKFKEAVNIEVNSENNFGYFIDNKSIKTPYYFTTSFTNCEFEDEVDLDFDFDFNIRKQSSFVNIENCLFKMKDHHFGNLEIQMT